MTHIDLLQVTKAYPQQPQPAVDAVSISVESGSLLALLGPSGSGKSTLLKLIAGIERPDDGDILFDAHSILGVAAHQRGAVLMFQKAYLFPFLSVAENIAFGLKLQRASPGHIRAEVARMLDLVELPGIEQKGPAQLSGGEQQRVALARALVIQPRVLLLDEPFSNLDAAVRQTLQEAVRALQREFAITMILVTHDRSEALSMADQVALIDRGHVLACGGPQAMFQRPPTRRAAQLMGVTTFLHGSLLEGSLQSELGKLSVCCDAASEGRVTYAIRPEHMRLWDAPGPNRLAADLLGHSFRGEQHEYQVRVGQMCMRVLQPIVSTPAAQLFVELPREHLFPVYDDVSIINK